jgi:ATPase subunit of ABC transporter with duplicated ATPase domains
MLKLENVSKYHGQQILFVDSSMSLFAREKAGLVGPNGAGKSTVFRMLVGEEKPDDGQVSVDRGITIGYFSQTVGEMKGRSVLAETMAGAGEVATLGAELAQLEAAMADPDRMDEMDAIITRYGEVPGRFEELDGYGLEARAREILAGLRFAEEVVNDDVGKLSGGWKMRVALARILLLRPDVLLLDEPTNHLDLESIIWLEQFLKGFDGALMITSHDRYFLNRLVTKIVEIDGGEMTTYSGNYDFYEGQKALSEKQKEAQMARQQAMLAKERAFIERFKARASHAAQVQSRVKKLEKIDVLEPPRQRYVPSFDFKEPPRSGDDVVRLDKVSRGFGTRVIYQNFDWLIRRKERWCVMGVNGAGKSTLLRMIAGQLNPDTGTVMLGAAVKLGYFAQHAMDILDPQETVIQSLQRQFPMASLGIMKNLAAAFGFRGDDTEKPCRILSGGEKARLVLAGMLYDPPNFLVLDEPTNHLDMDTKRMLIDALSNYEGTMVFVSHDRAFLDLVSNRVLEVNTDGVHLYPGGYHEYVTQTGYEAPGLR